MQNWKIMFKNGDTFEIVGTMKDAFEVCYNRNEIPCFLIGKRIHG